MTQSHIAKVDARIAELRQLRAQMAEQELAQRDENLEIIIAKVAAFYGVTNEQIVSPSKVAKVVCARSAVCWFARQLTSLTYDRIATRLGRATPCSGMWGEHYTQDRLDTEPPFRQQHQLLAASIEAELETVHPTQLNQIL